MFAERLKVLRKGLGITQAQFAEVFKIAHGTIAMWETGRREPDFETAIRIADYFHVSVDYLIGRDEKEKPTPVSEDGPALDKSLVDRLIQLSPEEQKMVEAFVQGMIAERSANGT